MPRPLHVVSLILTLSVCASAQGDTGFLRGKGRGVLATSYSLDSYDHFWVGNDKVDGDAAGVGEVERTTLSVYAAYGLRDDLDLVMNGSYVRATADGPGAGGGFPDEQGLQDLVLGAKWRGFERGGLSLLAAPAIKLPMSRYEDDDVTAFGDGQTDFRLRGIAHYQVQAFFASLESGYDVRSGAPEDEIPIHLTLGATYGPVTITPFYSQVISLGGIDIDEIPTQGGFPATQEESSRYGISLYARLGERFGATAGYRTTVDGRNTGDADTLFFGLVYAF
jgi:hypothetical protein